MVHEHPVTDSDKHFIIDPITRAVTNAESKKNLLMQNDHNSERFTFEIDRYVEGHDMKLCNRVEVHYSNVDSNKTSSNLGVYEVDDVSLNSDETKIVFSWLVSENATLYSGSLNFLVLFACVENGETVYRWNSAINNSITIAKGMYNGDEIAELYPDILSQWKEELFAAVYGYKVVAIGPSAPDTYPYIWFNNSEYGDSGLGIITVKDADGIVYSLYPVTKMDAVEGLNEALTAINTAIDNNELSITELQKMLSDLANTITPESIGAVSAEDFEGFATHVDESFLTFNDDLHSHGHGEITSDGKIGDTEGLPLFTREYGNITTKTADEARSLLNAAEKINSQYIENETYDVSIALADNTEYTFSTSVNTMTLTFPESSFECLLIFEAGDAFVLDIPDTAQLIGKVPDFTAYVTYEMSIKNGIIIFGEVVAQ